VSNTPHPHCASSAAALMRLLNSTCINTFLADLGLGLGFRAPLCFDHTPPNLQPHPNPHKQPPHRSLRHTPTQAAQNEGRPSGPSTHHQSKRSAMNVQALSLLTK
jgi:hypothetical protein